MERDLGGGVELILGKLYFTTLRNVPRSSDRCLFFSMDNELYYMRFNNDFGPLNLGQTYRFCAVLRQKLTQEACGRPLYYYTSSDPQKRTNAVCLICAYLVLVMNYTPEDAFAPFQRVHQTFLPFRDASVHPCTFNLTILDCLHALSKAKKLGWINLPAFRLQEYEYFERIENGDMNWIIPGKFLGFSGPQALPPKSGFRTHPPEFYIPVFKKFGISAVVRLNSKCYDRKRFIESGIQHYDLYFPDGSTPSDGILNRFLDIAEKEQGGIAVHCKAGLGRTGTLIAAYMIKHFSFTASEAIGWIRLCRPGSIIGPQQHFLQAFFTKLQKSKEENSLPNRLAEMASPFDSRSNSATPSQAPLSDQQLFRISNKTPPPQGEMPILPPSVSRRSLSSSLGDFPLARRDSPSVARQSNLSTTPDSALGDALRNRSNGDFPVTRSRMPQITPTKSYQPSPPSSHSPVIARTKPQLSSSTASNSRSTSVPHRPRLGESVTVSLDSNRRFR